MPPCQPAGCVRIPVIGPGGDDHMDGLRMSSITYRIATGRDAGRKVVTLQTLPGDAGSLEGEAGKVGGFSLHAGIAAEEHESHKLEKLSGTSRVRRSARSAARRESGHRRIPPSPFRPMRRMLSALRLRTTP